MTMKNTPHILIIIALAILFFSPNIVRGGLMLPMDVLQNLAPFSASAPKESAPVHNPLLWDLAVMIYPWIEEFRRSGTPFPLWNPYSFCGSPLLANGQTGLLYPLSWIYRILPLGAALIVIAVAKLSFCGIFAFLFYRKLDFQRQACLLGALALMFGSMTVVWLGYPASFTLVTMPFLFWALQNYLSSGDRRHIAWMAVGYGLLFLGGGLQTALLLSLASALYFALTAPRAKLYPALLVAALLGFCLAAPQLLPFLEYLGEGAASHFRGGFGWKLYPWFTLQSWVMPRFFGDPRAGNFWGFSSYLGEAVYIGIAPLLLAAVGLVFAQKNRFYWSILAVAGLGILGMYAAPAQELLKRFPFLSHLDNNKFPALVVFGVVSFAVAGLDYLLREAACRLGRAALVWHVTAILWAALAAGAGFFFHDAIRELGLQRFLTAELWLQLGVLLSITATFWLWRIRRLPPSAAAWILLALTAGDLFRLSVYYYPSPQVERPLPRSTAVEFLQQNSGEGRFLGLAGWVPPEISILYRLQDARGIDGHTPFRCYEILSRIDPAVHDLLARLQAGAPKPGTWTPGTLFFRSIEHHLNATDPEIRSALRQLDYWSYDVTRIENPGLLSVLGVRYVVGPKGAAAPADAGFPLVHSSDADVWENPSALPRAFVSTRPEFVVSEAEALATISAPGFAAGNAAVINLQGRSFPSQQVRARPPDLLPAHIDSYAPGQVRISAEAPEGGWLVLSDLYYPGWEAFIDGVPAPIYQGNYLFRAVELSPGKHQVQFVYRPAPLRIGIVLCILALAIVVVLSKPQDARNLFRAFRLFRGLH
jgi:hypothetical protein